MAKADEYLDRVYKKLSIENFSDEEKYNAIDRIVDCLHSINDSEPIDGKTTGTISERLCELGLNAAVPNNYSKISGRSWNWMADFSVTGNPFNVLISVKSFKAKERLLVSGSGNNLSPTIGWGLFNDKKEFSKDRVQKYLYRSFFIIYLPQSTLDVIDPKSKELKNLNQRPILRSISLLISDLKEACLEDGKIDIHKL